MPCAIFENSDFGPNNDGTLPTNLPLLNLPNTSSKSTKASEGGAEQESSNDGFTSKMMNDMEVAVMPSSVSTKGYANELENSNLSVSYGVCVGQHKTPRTCNAKGKSAELNVSEEKKKILNPHFLKVITPFRPTLPMPE